MHALKPKPVLARRSLVGLSAARGQHGVSLIEVLIAMLLVALGTLAIVLLQLSAKRNNLDAAQRALAAQVGYGFLERIRGNNSAEGLLAYQSAAGSGATFGGSQQAYSGPNCGAGSDCSPALLADYDSRQFEIELDGAAETIGGTNVGGLISPRACLTSSAPGGGSTNFTLTIVWRGTGSFPDNTAINCARNLTGSPYGADDAFRRTLTLNAFVAAR